MRMLKKKAIAPPLIILGIIVVVLLLYLRENPPRNDYFAVDKVSYELRGNDIVVHVAIKNIAPTTIRNVNVKLYGQLLEEEFIRGEENIPILVSQEEKELIFSGYLRDIKSINKAKLHIKIYSPNLPILEEEISME